MTAPFIKFIKWWLIIVTLWLGFITLVVLLLAYASFSTSLYDPKLMFTRWSRDRDYLEIGCAGGDFVVTHLKDVNRHAYAELPKPLFVASSGGVSIPASDLTKLTWVQPPDMYESAFQTVTNGLVAAPTNGSPIEAIYLFPAHAEFKQR